MPESRPGENPFASYHRARRAQSAHRALGAAIAVFAMLLASSAMLSAASVPSASDGAQLTMARAEGAPPIFAPAALPADAPADASAATPTFVAQVLASTDDHPAPRAWSISIATTGYQTELDQCQWVSMRLDIAMPIVAAHNTCGGRVVLDMNLGDSVRLSGTGLDGEYRVTDFRDAHSGEDAAVATAGMAADVILQTCYHNTGGRVRLVALTADLRENG